MGIGHYYPRNFRDIHYRMVNIHQSEELGYDYDNEEYADDPAQHHSFVWQDLIYGMQVELSKIAPTGQPVKEWDDDTRILYRTPLLDVTITDNQVLFAIVVRPRVDFDGDREANLAPRHIDRVAERLFNYLQRVYGELSIPTGGYTSASWNGDINNA